MAEGPIDEVYELFLDLDADEQQIDFPIVYCNCARDGRRLAATTTPKRRDRRTPRICQPLFRTSYWSTIPAPAVRP